MVQHHHHFRKIGIVAFPLSESTLERIIYSLIAELISKEKESYWKKNMLNKKVYRDFRPYIAKKQFLCTRILKS